MTVKELIDILSTKDPSLPVEWHFTHCKEGGTVFNSATYSTQRDCLVLTDTIENKVVVAVAERECKRGYYV